MKQLLVPSDIDTRTIIINQNNKLESRCLVDTNSLVLYIIEPTIWCYAKAKTEPQSLALMAVGSIEAGELKYHGNTLWVKPLWFDELVGDMTSFNNKWVKLQKSGMHHQIAYFTNEQPPEYEETVKVNYGDEDLSFNASFDRRNPNAGFLIRLKFKHLPASERMKIALGQALKLRQSPSELSDRHLNALFEDDHLQFLGESIPLDGQGHSFRYPLYPEGEAQRYVTGTLQASINESDPNQIEIVGKITHIPTVIYQLEADLLNTPLTSYSSSAIWLYSAEKDTFTVEEFEQEEET